MDEDTFQTNMVTLKEMVLDEERLVTYVSLSKDLCIHVNQSKSLLKKLVEDTRKKDPVNSINVNYIISGITDDNKARTTVCSEQDLADTRKAFKTIFFEHVYSVSKGLSKVDNVAFLAVNKFEDFPLCTGLIKSNVCVKRSLNEIGVLKSNSQASVKVESKPSNPLVKKTKTEPKDHHKNGQAAVKEVTKVHESKSEPTIKTEIPSPKKDEPINGNSKQDFKKNGHKSQKGIAGFFSKSNSAPNKKALEATIKNKEEINSKSKAEKNEPVVKTEKKTEKMEVDEEVKDKKVETESKLKQETKDKTKSKSESLNQIKKNAKVDKKRKRVLHVSDSESDGEKDPFVDEPEPRMDVESEDEIPPTPATNTVKITSGITNPKKRRKIVDKTYTDEDGYILTKKEEVYESCSDNEDSNCKENVVQENKAASPKKPELSPKKNAPKGSKKKISPPQKGKQATLMNFFKKV